MSERQRILIVEDDDQIATVLRDTLCEEGYEARCAANGRLGLSLLQQWVPHVIILDLMMPVMDGQSFRAAQRALPRPMSDPPVIVLSGARDGHAQAEALAAHAFIAKPFELDDVLYTVARVCGAR
jgi:two-component system OmpR family response regulator